VGGKVSGEGGYSRGGSVAKRRGRNRFIVIASAEGVGEEAGRAWIVLKKKKEWQKKGAETGRCQRLPQTRNAEKRSRR